MPIGKKRKGKKHRTKREWQLYNAARQRSAAAGAEGPEDDEVVDLVQTAPIVLEQAAEQNSDDNDGDQMPPQKIRPTTMRLKTGQNRLGIAQYYIQCLGLPPPSEWDGRDGAIRKTMQTFGISEGSRRVVKEVFTRVNAAAEDGCEEIDLFDFAPTDIRVSCPECLLIPPGGNDERMIVRLLEQGVGVRQCTFILNTFRVRRDEPHVGVTTVWAACRRLNPLVTAIQKRKQGSSDPDSEWARSRLNWVTQLMVLFLLLDKVTLGGDACPRYFDSDIVGTLVLVQVAFWDETHKIVQVGGNGQDARRKQIRFYKDADGNVRDKDGKPYTAETGSVSAPQQILRMKYTDEARLSLGVAKVQMPDRTIIGKRAEPFDYTGQWVCTITTWRQLIAEQIRTVKGYSDQYAKNAGWLVDTRTPEDGLFEEDSVRLMSRVGNKSEEALNALGVFKIGQLAHMSQQKLDECNQKLSATGRGVSIAKLTQLRQQAREAKVGSFDRVPTDYRAAENPYRARFGDLWEEEIAKHGKLKANCCVTSLWTHIMNATRKMFEGTIHANTWVVYHDALKQLTDARTIEWMKNQFIQGKSFYDRWLVPREGLNDQFARYKGRPVGNSPEMMPLDCSLNKDIDDGVKRHIGYTFLLDHDDPAKFSRSTPKRLADSYKRLYWHLDADGNQTFDPATGGCPSSERIIEDIDKCMGPHLQAIREHKGCMVPDLGSHHGRRRGDRVHTRGGDRQKAAAPQDFWIHPSAQPAVDAMYRVYTGDDGGGAPPGQQLGIDQ